MSASQSLSSTLYQSQSKREHLTTTSCNLQTCIVFIGKPTRNRLYGQSCFDVVCYPLNCLSVSVSFCAFLLLSAKESLSFEDCFHLPASRFCIWSSSPWLRSTVFWLVAEVHFGPMCTKLFHLAGSTCSGSPGPTSFKVEKVVFT